MRQNITRKIPKLNKKRETKGLVTKTILMTKKQGTVQCNASIKVDCKKKDKWSYVKRRNIGDVRSMRRSEVSSRKGGSRCVGYGVGYIKKEENQKSRKSKNPRGAKMQRSTVSKRRLAKKGRQRYKTIKRHAPEHIIFLRHQKVEKSIID